MNWKALVMQMATIALSANPKTAVLAPYVGAAVSTTEDLLNGKSGAEKLAHAVSLVKLGIHGTNAMRPGTIDEGMSDALIGHSISAVVDAANLVHKSASVAPAA